MSQIVIVGLCVACGAALRGPKPGPDVARVTMDCPKCGQRNVVELPRKSELADSLKQALERELGGPVEIIESSWDRRK